MRPWHTIGSEGALSLRERDGEYLVLTDGRVLMGSRRHASEDVLGATCRGLRAGARVLLGGLGFGYTLRAALDVLPPDATLVVAEVAGAVVEWNRGPLAHLAGRPLEDGRVSVRVADVADVLAEGPFDAILLDVDNGPYPVSRPENARLYSADGLRRLRDALAPGGRLAVWSAGDEPAFSARLRAAGFDPTVRHPHSSADSAVVFVATRR